MAASRLVLFAFIGFLIPCFIAAADVYDQVNGLHNRRKGPNYPTFVVDKSGHGQFSTLQAAIDHVPSNNQNWFRIYVRAGNYREQVHIPMEKPYIYIQGDGKWRTRVSWDGFESITSATFICSADNIVVKSISFINNYNYPLGENGNPVRPAVAAMIAGDKSAFYRVGFVGFQDTLWDVQGRHFFSQCTIQGAVDFIFGAGQSLYERCVISVVAGALPRGVAGFITAQGRSNPSDPNGFIFKECSVIGNGLTFLGRPWREYARVVFFNSTLSNIIVPEGWGSWIAQGREYQLTFTEYDCLGEGSNIAHRVPWEYKMSKEMVGQLSSISFVDNDGWISNLPLKLAT